MNKNIKALIHSKDDIGQLVYDPYPVDLGRLTITRELCGLSRRSKEYLLISNIIGKAQANRLSV